jgi:hypothetical protein
MMGEEEEVCCEGDENEKCVFYFASFLLLRV